MTNTKDKKGLNLANVINLAIDRFAETLHTSTVGKITEINYPKMTVQPLVRSNDGREYEELPLLFNVPLHLSIMASGAAWFLSPVEVGDTGLILFLENSIDNWLESNGSDIVDPDGIARHDLSDAVFIPGIQPFSKNIKALSGTSETNYGNDKVQVGSTKHPVEVIAGANELLLQAATTASLLATSVTVGGSGTEQPAVKWTNLDLILASVFAAIDGAITGLGGAAVAVTAYNNGKLALPPNSLTVNIKG